MSRKSKTPKHPSLALALVAIAAPLFFGQMHTSLAASADSARLAPKSQHFWMFDVKAFRESVRQRRIQGYAPKVNAPTKSSSSLPTGQAGVSSSSDSSVSSSAVSSSLPAGQAGTSSKLPATIEDLTMPQREQLRRFLRTGVCPFNADMTKLCEKLLKEQKSQRPMRGWKNSNEK